MCVLFVSIEQERESVRAIHVQLLPQGVYRCICCVFHIYIIMICIYTLFCIEQEKECVRAIRVQPLPQAVYNCIHCAKQSAVFGSMYLYTCIHTYM